VQFFTEEYDKVIEINGYRNIDFEKAESFLKSCRKHPPQNGEVQFFEADLIATEQHLYFAALNALLAFENKTNISKNVAIETILYASAQRQIQKAIDLIGIKPKTQNMAIVIIGEEPCQIENELREISSCVKGNPDSSTLQLTGEKKAKILKDFQITSKEIETINYNATDETIVNLIIERMALLTTQL
jgi:KEOPS complex subunit Cgi121